jgi:hypothetical protein
MVRPTLRDSGDRRLSMEPLTAEQIITALIALLAIVVSLVSLHRTSKVQEQQLRLQKKQEELTDLQLEALRKQAKLATSTNAPPAVQEKADVRVDLEKMGRGEFKFFITNWGSVPARNVTFDLELEAGKRSPLVKGDYEKKIPIQELGPGNRIPLWAAITMGMGTSFPARWSWENPDGTIETRKSLLAI